MIKLNYKIVNLIKSGKSVKELGEEINNVKFKTHGGYGTFTAEFCKKTNIRMIQFGEKKEENLLSETAIKRSKKYKLTDNTPVHAFVRLKNGYAPLYNVDDCEKL